MRTVPFDATEWESARTLSGARASSLSPCIRRLAACSWRDPASVSDWVKITREIVDGPEVSVACELVLPWLVELCRGRPLVEQAQAWGLIGEVELGRLTGVSTGPTIESVIKAAAEVALEHPGGGQAKAQNEHGAMIAALPDLPEWGRMLVLRLVLIGQRYVSCPSCEELLDLEWDGHWRIGGAPVEPLPLSAQRQGVVGVILSRANEHRAPALQAIEELSGTLRCPAYSASTDCMAMIARPQLAP